MSRIAHFRRTLRRKFQDAAWRRTDRRVQRHLSDRRDHVASGPFAGMRMLGHPKWNRWSLYVSGSYEAELHEVLERLLALPFTTVVDVGAADGYYAIGLARRLPDADVFAFDIDRDSQDACHQLARVNGVAARVHVGGECTVADLAMLGGERTLMVVDCEGGELALLRPDHAPSLSMTTLLVELHDFVDPTATAVVLQRFRSTHDALLIDVAPRRADAWPILKGLSSNDQARVMDERRPTTPHPMQWVVLVPSHLRMEFDPSGTFARQGRTLDEFRG